eukprot:364999-Chlamydomonas_euryale.AAC.24
MCGKHAKAQQLSPTHERAGEAQVTKGGKHEQAQQQELCTRHAHYAGVHVNMCRTGKCMRPGMSSAGASMLCMSCSMEVDGAGGSSVQT